MVTPFDRYDCYGVLMIHYFSLLFTNGMDSVLFVDYVGPVWMN